MTVFYKQGCVGDLQPVARKGLGRVASLAAGYGQDLMVTSIRDGNHSDGSLHYDGLAFDFRPFRIPGGQAAVIALRALLGRDWDVVDGGDHVHCEYDPR